jgi:signal transduction histidine kinase
MTLEMSDKAAATPGGDHSRAAVDFAHRMLQIPASSDEEGQRAQDSLPTLLRQLAEAFAARGAGLATSVQDSPIVRHVQVNGPPAPSLPWEIRPEILSQVRATAGTVAIAEAAGASWLLAAVWHHDAEGWLLWLQDAPGRTWSSGESAALILAGQAMARLATSRLQSLSWSRCLERAQFQRRLDHAAAVTGRLAHDFGNILTGILGFAELTRNQVQGDPLCRQYVKEIYQSAN